MNSKLAALVVIFVAVGLVGNAYAHKAQVLGDYEIEVGWTKEPPKAGKANAIEISIVKASSADKKAAEKTAKSHDEHDDTKTAQKKTTTKAKTTHEHKVGVKGLAKILEVDVTLNGKKTSLTLKENSKKSGIYTGKYTPDSEGHPTVHIYGKIKNKVIEGTFHPEKVEK
ncbi:MAG: hypothetical protein HZC29_09365 [Thaumarchaeota archaeon]|nr:hypothetical protein [Nitrososphaerota archaeon]